MNILVCEENMISVTCLFLKDNNTIGKSSNQKSLSSVNIHSLTCILQPATLPRAESAINAFFEIL